MKKQCVISSVDPAGIDIAFLGHTVSEVVDFANTLSTVIYDTSHRTFSWLIFSEDMRMELYETSESYKYTQYDDTPIRLMFTEISESQMTSRKVEK